MHNTHTKVDFLSKEKNGKTLTFKNPILTASGTFGNGVEFTPYGDITTLGGIVVKGLSLIPREGNPLPRIAETPSGMLNAIGLQNDGIDNFIKNILPALPYNDVPIIANMYATSLEDFTKLANKINTAQGISAIEVNISCPNVKEGGVLFGQDPILASSVTSAVKEAAPNLPIIIKLTPNVTSIAQLAFAVEKAGADAISLINTMPGMAVDIRKRKPILANKIGGLSGPALKPIALRCLYEARQAVNLPIIGIGGIMNAEDVLEFLLLGASAVQIGTANFIDPSLIFKIVHDLPLLLQDLGYASVEEYCKDYYK